MHHYLFCDEVAKRVVLLLLAIAYAPVSATSDFFHREGRNSQRMNTEDLNLVSPYADSRLNGNQSSHHPSTHISTLSDGGCEIWYCASSNDT